MKGGPVVTRELLEAWINGQAVLPPGSVIPTIDGVSPAWWAMQRELWRGKKEAAKLLDLYGPQHDIEALHQHLLARPARAATVIALVDEIARRAVSKNQSERAAKKNLEARAWVVTEWARIGSEFNGKADFARVMLPIIKKNFPKISRLSAEQIWRDWLPKTRKR